MLSVLGSTKQSPTSFVEKFPQHLTEFKMIKLPDGESNFEGKTTKIKNLYISETEIPWEVFEIWALRLDQTAEEIAKDPQGKGVDATTRPSRPYAAIFIGFGHHTYPAICMSSFAAEEYCKWLSKRTGKKYRLPTPAEWVYANPDVESENSIWCWENADDTTHEVQSKTANKFGLKNMSGNAAEWVRLADGKYGVIGSSFRDKFKSFKKNQIEPYDPKWNENDPQNPKSRWWLANGQFVGLRLVCEM
jgi:formylglycine-generating enzyme required for sulfatase activity